MRKKISARHLCSFFIAGLIVFASIVFFLHSPSAERNTLAVDDLINTGKTQLFQRTISGALQSYGTFESIYNTSYETATDQQKIKIRTYLAVTRMLDLLLRDDSNGQIDTVTKLYRQYGMLRTGTDLDTFKFPEPVNDDKKIIIPISAPSGESVRSFLAGPMLTVVNSSIADMDAAIALCPTSGEGIDKEIIEKNLFDATDPTQKDVEADAGDYYLFRAGLKAAKAYALVISAYDMNVNVREIAALLNIEALNFRQLLERNTNLLKLLTTGSTPSYNGAARLAEAKTVLKEAIDDYLIASDKIRNDSDTTPGAEELISLSPEDVQDEAKFRTNLTSLRDSLINSNTADLLSGTSDHVYLNLNPLFGGTINLRDLLPQFSDYGRGIPIPGTMGYGLSNDPTLGGILPGYTQDRWTRELDYLQPSGLVTIPTATIDVQDVSVGDWGGILPSPLIFTDATGDAKDNNGLDISKVYLAKDSSNLYVRMDAAGTIPQSGNEWLKYVLTLKKLPGDQYDLPGDVRIFVVYNPWPAPTWQASVEKFDSNLNINPVYNLDPSSFQVFGNSIEIAVPLTQAGEMSGRFIAAKTEKWWERIDDDSTGIQISPVATVTGTLTVPQYDGVGPIYVGVFQYNTSFNTDPQRRIGGRAIYPDQYTPGMTYTINNLPVGERVFIAVHWDKDVNGIISPGDYTNFSLPFTLAAGAATQNLSVADDHPAYDAPQFTSTSIFSNNSSVVLRAFLTGPSPNDVSVTVKGPGGEFTLPPLIFVEKAGLGLAYAVTLSSLPDGDYVFEAVDSLGRKASASCHYQYDGSIPPISTVSFSPANNAYVNTTTPTLSWSAPGAGTYFYQVYVLDSRGLAYWYVSSILSTTSVTVPSGVLQPDTPYQWFVRVYNQGTAPMNSKQSPSSFFYTGASAANPSISFGQLISQPPTGAITSYRNNVFVGVPGVAPWDVTYCRLKDASGTVLYTWSPPNTEIRFNQSSFLWNSYYTVAPLPSGNYTIEVMTTHSASPVSISVPYQFNAVQAVDVTTLIPSDNYYFNNLTPTFSWAPVSDQNTYYMIRIYDPMIKLIVWQSSFLKDTSVTVPEGILLPGGAYYWTLLSSSDFDPSRSTVTGQFNSINCVNTEGNNSSGALFRFTISPNPVSFSLSSSDVIKVIQGNTKQIPITLTSIGGFNAPVTMTYEYEGAAPANAGVILTSDPVFPTSGGTNATLQFNTAADTPTGTYTLKITATGGTITKTKEIQFTVYPPMGILTTSLPDGTNGVAYPATTIGESGGIPPFTFSKLSGSLPDGLMLNSDGSISGTPTARGTFTFTAQVQDGGGNTASKDYSLRVYDPSFRQFVLEWCPLGQCTSPVWTVSNSSFSEWIRVKVIDDHGQPVIMSSPVQIQLASPSSTGRFYDGYSTSSSNSFRPWIQQDSSFVEIQYKDTSAGVFNITASRINIPNDTWQIASHAITVTSPTLKNATLTTSVTQAATYGQGIAITGILKDAATSTPLNNKTISIVFTSPSGTQTTENYALTGSDGKYAYPAGADLIDTAGTWTVQVTFRDSDPAVYNGVSTTVSFGINKADTRITLFVDKSSTNPTGQVTVSGQLSSFTTVPVDLSGINIIIDFIEPNGTTVHSATTQTYDPYGHFSYTYTNQFASQGLWTIDARLAGAGNFNSSVSDTKDLTVATTAGYVILIEGDSGGQYRANYTAGLDDIYNKLVTKRSFKAEDIYYLSFEGTGHVHVNDVTTKQKVADAITTWAYGRIAANGVAPLYIIMMDHGSKGAFHIDPETITPDELNGWITTLETNVQNNLGKPLTTVVINGSCYSGSFIPTLSKAGRVVITSSADDEVSAQGPVSNNKTYGEYFIYYLFNYLSKGDTLRDSFKEASQAIQQYRGCRSGACGTNALSNVGNTRQHPLLDDNGDGKGNWMSMVGQGDGAAAASIVLGLGTNPVSITFTGIMPTTKVMSGTSSVTAWAKTSDPAATAASWVEVKKPSYVAPDAGGTGQVLMNLPKVTGTYNQTASRWEYSVPLDEPGAYTLYYYAMDSVDGDVIPPVTATLYVDTSANNPPLSFNLNTPDDNTEIDDAMMIFKWETATDPDGDPVTYTVKIYEDINGAKGSEIKRYELISQEFYFINAIKEKRNDGVTTLFATGGNYWWEVEAIDNKGKSRTSIQARKFHILFTNAMTGIISGIVLSDRDYSKIAAATITAAIGSQTVTILVTNGTFAMAVNPGPVDLSGISNGYQNALVSDVSVRAGDVTVMNITMKPTGNILTVYLTGAGEGSVASNPAGIQCGASCQKAYNAGASVTLTATPDESSNFTGWSGACSGAGACTVIMNEDKTVSATFSLKGDLDGNGTVDIADAILALEVISRVPLTPSASIHKEADVNGDGRIGIAEIIYIIQKVAGMRDD